MKETKIVISMIVLLYRGRHYLKRIIDMYSRNCRRFEEQFPCLTAELILVNDDPGEEVILPHEDFEFQDISLVQNKRNMGIHQSKIEGLKIARGEFIFFLDQDDLISPFYFAEQYKLIDGCDAVVCNVDLGEGPHYLELHEEALDLNCYIKGYNGISSLGQVLIRKECIPKEWKSHSLSRNGADDYFLILLMLLKRQPVAEHRKALYYHVYTGDNFSTDFKAICLSVIEVLERLEQIGLIAKEISDVAIENRRKDIEEFEKIRKKYPGNIWQERLDNIRLINLYDRCLKNLEADYKMDSYIKTYRCSRIAVYGAGKMGKHFLYWMQNADIEITILIDRVKKGEINGIPIVDLHEAQERSGTFDMIVVTPMVQTKDIVMDLEGLFTCPIISLDTVVYNMSCQLLEAAHKTKTARYIFR